jgi:hypothetical protein
MKYGVSFSGMEESSRGGGRAGYELVIQKRTALEADLCTNGISRTIVFLVSYCPSNEQKARLWIHAPILRGCLDVSPSMSVCSIFTHSNHDRNRRDCESSLTSI